jgi:hypothetical protein
MNFYEILLEELSNTKVDSNEDTNEKTICLITKEKLQDNFITLDCGHRFNYVALYHELLKQKTNTNLLEIVSIKINETKCPYCRQITPKILPFIDISGVKVIKGVTSPKTFAMKLNDCEWIFLNGKKKGTQCKCSAIKTNIGTYCKLHETIVSKPKSKPKPKPNPNVEATSATTEELITICKKYPIPLLKFFLKSLNLKVSGNKSQLIERLVKYNGPLPNNVP